jgi:hypothetical protein
MLIKDKQTKNNNLEFLGRLSWPHSRHVGVSSSFDRDRTICSGNLTRSGRKNTRGNPQDTWVGMYKIRSRRRHNCTTITGPVDRFYLWKEWNTHTVVDASSTQTLTLPSLLPSTSSFENTGSLFPSRTKPLVLFRLSKNPTGGFLWWRRRGWIWGRRRGWGGDWTYSQPVRNKTEKQKPV